MAKPHLGNKIDKHIKEQKMKNYKLTKAACYFTNVTMSIVANLSPLLFLTFREMYDLSFTLLGLLVVINFATQLTIDLVFSFFAKYFNIHKTVRLTPFIAFIGLVFYAVMPMLIPSLAFLWIVIGTVVFSVSAGLAEVLISPVVAAMPSENPEREMSKLHSIYAWGVVGVVIISTAFLHFCGTENWHILALIWSLVPLCASILFAASPLPDMNVDGGGQSGKIFSPGLILCFLLIFLGGASECTMSQWVSGFAEEAIGVPKMLGDVFGLALFGAMLGLGRTAYAKFGKKIINVMFFGMIGAAVCYITAAASGNAVISLVACGMTGLFTSMLWPGTLIYAEEKITGLGVAAYALLAAGGDLGASVVPQLVGILSDSIDMRAGMLSAAIFPICGIFLILFIKKYFSKKEKSLGKE